MSFFHSRVDITQEKIDQLMCKADQLWAKTDMKKVKRILEEIYDRLLARKALECKLKIDDNEHAKYILKNILDAW